jgi:hypothetical protein
VFNNLKNDPTSTPASVMKAAKIDLGRVRVVALLT